MEKSSCNFNALIFMKTFQQYWSEMACPGYMWVFLCSALILSFVAEQSIGQHLRWGKRDEVRSNEEKLINKGESI